MAGTAQRSFQSGESSPRVHARTDLAAYATSLKAARNVVVMPTGGVQSRPGFEYLGTAKLANDATIVVDCVLATDQAYVLELGAAAAVGSGYIRFWLDGARVTFTNPTAWATATAYAVGDLALHNGVAYYCQLAHTSAATTEPGTGATWQTAWWPQEEIGATDVYILEVPTPYAAADLARLQFADESATTRLVAHPDYPMRSLVRVGATAWTFNLAAYSAADDVDAPTNLAIADPGTGMAADFTRYMITAVEGNLESEGSNIAGWNKRPGPVFLGDFGDAAPLALSWDAVADADAYRVYRSLSMGPFVLIVEVTDNEYTDKGALGGTGVFTPPTEVGAVTDLTVATQYPGVITGFQQRLIVSGQTAKPDTVYGSRSANFRNFFPHDPIQDDDALSWRQVSGRLNRILHLAEAQGKLVAFSEIAEGLIQGDVDGIIRPGEINPRNFSFNGADATLRPLNLNTALLYVQSRGNVVRDVRPGTQVGSVNISLLSEHLLRRGRVRSWCYQQTPHSVVWLATTSPAPHDSTVPMFLSLTYELEAGIVGWARHDRDGTVLSMACVREPDASGDTGGRDAVYAVVACNGQYNIERMTNRQAASPRLMDSLVEAGGLGGAVAFAAAAGALPDRITGLEHLAGKSVSLVSGGTVVASPNNPDYTTRTVHMDGYLAIDAADVPDTDDFAVGLPFTCDAQTLDLDTVNGRSIKGSDYLITNVGLWLEDSLSCFCGPEAPTTGHGLTLPGGGALQPLQILDRDQNVVTAAQSGYREVNIEGRWTPSGSVFIRHVDPVPLTILALIPTGHFPRGG